MAYYRTCPYCGANLDPGERCDCRVQAAFVDNGHFLGSRRCCHFGNTSWKKESAAAHAANMDNGSAGQTTNTTTVTHSAGEVNPPLTEQTRRALLKSPSAWDFDGYILRAMRAGCAAARKGVI